jgi:peptidoglycan/LPS O-acetylase OafA/YrhL
LSTLQKAHIKSLDGLRGAAILMVFLFHYWPRASRNPISALSLFGWSGVDLFLVLSGFLITGILYDARKSSNYFKSFYMRRALRLFPVYFLAIAVVIIGTHFLRGFRSWLDIPFFLYGANVVVVLPSATTHFPPYFECRHFWSLALEEQFYSIWPFIVFLVPSRKRLIQLCLGGIGIALVLRTALAALGADAEILHVELPTRMDSLLTGALLALALRGPDQVKWLEAGRLRWTFGVSVVLLAIAIVAGHSWHFSSRPMETAGFTVLAAMFGCILALALISGTLTNRIFSNRVLRFYGRYSYGLYVWHYLLYPLTSRFVPTFLRIFRFPILGEAAFTLAMLAMFTGAAVLSYSFFESYFLAMKSKFEVKHRPESIMIS